MPKSVIMCVSTSTLGDADDEYRGREGYVVSPFTDDSRDFYATRHAEQANVTRYSVYVLLDGADESTLFLSDELTNYSLRRRRAAHTIAEHPVRMGRPRMLRRDKIPVTILVDQQLWSGLSKFVEMGRARSKNEIAREALKRYSAELHAELATSPTKTDESA